MTHEPGTRDIQACLTFSNTQLLGTASGRLAGCDPLDFRGSGIQRKAADSAHANTPLPGARLATAARRPVACIRRPVWHRISDPWGRDSDLAAAAAAIGLRGRALSGFYARAPARQGLVRGYAAFDTAEIRKGTARLAAIIAPASSVPNENAATKDNLNAASSVSLRSRLALPITLQAGGTGPRTSEDARARRRRGKAPPERGAPADRAGRPD